MSVKQHRLFEVEIQWKCKYVRTNVFWAEQNNAAALVSGSKPGNKYWNRNRNRNRKKRNEKKEEWNEEKCVRWV